MKKDIVNIELEQLEDKNARLPNGEYMDLYSLREEVLLYAVSIEGDDYIVGPLFYSAGDAILHSLNIKYLRDTIGFATEEKMANSPSSKIFRFNSMIRLREYRLDSRAFYYDARKKSKPYCSDVGVSNFKADFIHRLPHGNDVNNQGLYFIESTMKERTSKSQGLSVDNILKNIIQDSTEYQAINMEAFYFCEPGKRLRIHRSYRIDMSILWTFYAEMLSLGYDPSRIRSEAFIGPKSKIVILKIIQDRQTPSMIGDLPDKVNKGIEAGNDLNTLLEICATTVVGQKACVSGIFYEKLFKRDVNSIFNFFSNAAFDPIDKNYYCPKLNISTNLKTPYITNWFFSEDYILTLGRGSLAYNWNYNRYLDVNTVIFWFLYRMSKHEEKLSSKRLPFLITSPSYNPQEHMALIDHRFTEEEINMFQRIIFYDYVNEIRIRIMIGMDGEIYISTELLSGTSRAMDKRNKIQKELENFIDCSENSFKLSRGYTGIGIERSQEVQIILLNPSNQTINKIPTNWRILIIFSSFLRYLITYQEFDFMSFET